MSQERDIVSTSGKIIPLKELPPEQQKARIAQVLDRGVVGVRLHVDLPNDMYGEWVANDQESIFRMQTLGFDVDTTYAKNRALHNDGTDKAIVGDVIFMTCTKENKMLIEAVRNDKYNRDNRRKRDLPEENVVNQIHKEGLPVTNSSTQEFVGTGEIKTAVETA